MSAAPAEGRDARPIATRAQPDSGQEVAERTPHGGVRAQVHRAAAERTQRSVDRPVQAARVERAAHRGVG